MATTQNVPFDQDPVLKEQLYAVIDAHKGEKGALIPVLQEAQAIYGYLPIEVQEIVAERMNVPLEKIYGVITFYSFFNLYPKGKYRITVCLGTACYVKGSAKVLDKISDHLGIEEGQCTHDGLFSLDTCRCVGACGLAPVMLVNDDVYGHVMPNEVPDILAKYK
ncbi:MAG: NAD(P)H-dependent oxidoreductase subunit E [Parasporobacterium sp.]|nr:NAD(P)H-dependent oxidoreductase subunit E [Parasporobacterium sp.]